MEREKEMMELPKEDKKYSCKVCEKSFPSFQALGGHMRCHPGDLKRKTKSANGNEEPVDLTPEEEEELVLALIDKKKKSDNGKNEELEDLTPESKVKDVALLKIDLNEMPNSGEEELLENEELEDLTPESKVKDVALLKIDLNEMPNSGEEELLENEELEDLIPESKVKDVPRFEIDLNEMLDSGEEELLENDIPESGAEEASRKSEAKEKIEEADKPGPETDVSLTDLEMTVYECNTCHRMFGSQQVLGDHLTGQTSDGTCPQEIESTATVPRFNCDGSILRRDVAWATRRRSWF